MARQDGGKMAINLGSMIVSLKADVNDITNGLGNATKTLQSFSAGTVAKGILIAEAVKGFTSAIVSFGFDALKAFGAQQDAVVKLQQALKNQGLEVTNTTEELRAYATELQKTTRFEDETIVSSIALLTSFGLQGEELKKTTRAALDLAQGLGVDLNTAAKMLGKAALGNTDVFSRYGIVIDDNIPKAKKFEAVLGQINGRFGGSAQAALETVNGKLENMSNRFGDLKETIGEKLLPVFDFWVEKMEKAVGWVEKMTGAGEKEARGRELTIQTLEKERDELVKNEKARVGILQGVTAGIEAQRERLILITKAIKMEKEKLDAERTTAKASNK